jgi:hypothetical protein
MVAALLTERAILDEIEPRLRKRGYTLVREPSPDQLPGFLRGFQPDAIAIGPAPSLVIEVLRSGGRSAETRVRQIDSLFEGHEDWRLEVVYATTHGTLLEPVAPDDARAALHQALAVAEGEPRAGLLLAWATLEAITRVLEPKLAARSLPPASLVELLVAQGHLTQAEGARLRALGTVRNALAHGQIDASPAPADVRYLIDLGRRLIA